MHEYKLTLDIIEIASKYAARLPDEKKRNVSKIILTIGESSGVLGESIQLYFDEFSIGTVCEGAQIEIEWIKSKLKCRICGNYFERKPFSFSCTQENCDGEGEPTEIGREFYVKSILV